LINPVKSALNVLTAGTLNQAVSYLQMYIGGSKKRVLDYHRSQIEEQIMNAIAQYNFLQET
jgi:hypothetical protein